MAGRKEHRASLRVWLRTLVQLLLVLEPAVAEHSCKGQDLDPVHQREVCRTERGRVHLRRPRHSYCRRQEHGWLHRLRGRSACEPSHIVQKALVHQANSLLTSSLHTLTVRRIPRYGRSASKAAARIRQAQADRPRKVNDCNLPVSYRTVSAVAEYQLTHLLDIMNSSIRRKDVMVWDTVQQKWRLPQGPVTFYAGSSSRKLPLSVRHQF